MNPPHEESERTLSGQRSDLDIPEPRLHGPVALLHGDVVHHHHTVGLPKELLGYASVPVCNTAASLIYFKYKT